MTGGLSNLAGRFLPMLKNWPRNSGVAKLLRTIKKYFVLSNVIAVPMLRKKANALQKPAEIVALSQRAFTEFPYLHFGWQITPLQEREEMTKLLEITLKLQPKYLLEIGTASGGTLFAFAKTANPNATLISVDLPGGRFGAGYYIWRIPYYKSFALKRQKIRLLRGNSHDPSTLRKVKCYLKDAQLDLLFIDGDHTYKGVKQDYELYSPLVRKGGLIIFHDIAHHKPETGVEVDKFWSEIKQSRPHQEIIKNPDQDWAGIGIIVAN